MAKLQVHHPASIGITAAITGIALGIFFVYLDSADSKIIVHAQAGGAGQACGQYSFSGSPPVNDKGLTVSQWTTCMNQQCKGGQKLATCPNTVDSFCKQHCITDYTTPNPTANNCCMLSPNSGCTKVDGKCGGQLPEQKPEEQGKGGEMPKLPEIPKGGGGGGGAPPPTDPAQEECKQEPKPAHCPKTGISGLLGNLFGTSSSESGTGNTVQSTIKSVTDKLSSFLTGDTSAPSVNTTVTPTPPKNPTEATVTPVTPSASDAAQLQAGTSGGVSGGTNAGSGTNGQPAVTGFTSNAPADVNTSTGPILSAIRSVTARIQSILASLF